jgi:phosphate/sulfate permease
VPSVAWLVVLLIVALSFSFLSGINDASNMMASMLSARAMRPLSGLILVVVMELLGPLVFGTVETAQPRGSGMASSAAGTLELERCCAS